MMARTRPAGESLAFGEVGAWPVMGASRLRGNPVRHTGRAGQKSCPAISASLTWSITSVQRLRAAL